MSFTVPLLPPLVAVMTHSPTVALVGTDTDAVTLPVEFVAVPLGVTTQRLALLLHVTGFDARPKPVTLLTTAPTVAFAPRLTLVGVADTVTVATGTTTVNVRYPDLPSLVAPIVHVP